MVRTIKSKTAPVLNKGERAVLLPGPTRAEPWEWWALAVGGARRIGTFAQPAENRRGDGTTLALSVAEVFCLPLWLNEKDPAQLRGLISLQLELRGLQPRGQAAVFDWAVVAQVAARTLALVAVLPSNLSKEIQEAGYSTFDLSARYLPLPEDAITLWQEQDRLVFAMTRGVNLIYFQALPGNRITAGILQDLQCIRAALAMQEVIVSLKQIVLWADLTAETASLQETLQLPVRVAERPRPQPPLTDWKLVPAGVTQAKRHREARRFQTRILGLALLLYLLFLGGMMGQFLLTTARVNQLRQWKEQHAADLSLVHETQAAWKELRPVVDEKSYPLELLLHTAGNIPADRLHLTLFEAADGHLLIKAEAKDASAAFQFLDRLKKDPSFTAYSWDMAQPHLLPNDLAQVQIEGTRGPGDF